MNTNSLTTNEAFEKVKRQQRIRKIAEKCHLRIATNNGFFDKEYFIRCVYDSIKEALDKEESKIFEKNKFDHNPT